MTSPTFGYCDKSMRKLSFGKFSNFSTRAHTKHSALYNNARQHINVLQREITITTILDRTSSSDNGFGFDGGFIGDTVAFKTREVAWPHVASHGIGRLVDSKSGSYLDSVSTTTWHKPS